MSREQPGPEASNVSLGAGEAGRDRVMEWAFLGEVGYAEGTELQAELRSRVLEDGGPESLVFVEHPHTYTLGRNAKEADVLQGDQWLADRGVTVEQSDRGGQVTYHGPGQLVGYPILNLSPDRRDLRRYVQDLEATLVEVLATLGVKAEGAPDRDRIGVWVGHTKIASIGVHVKRWVTTHGFALNLRTDLEYFSGIVACGLDQVEMTSVEQLTGVRHAPADVAEICAEAFGRRFGREMRVAAGLSATTVNGGPGS